jgi:hypothetical protein
VNILVQSDIALKIIRGIISNDTEEITFKVVAVKSLDKQDIPLIKRLLQ